jgi:hypothetical protein
MLIQLPNGLLEGDTLYNYAQIDELRGKQQNYLANRDLIMDNLGHVPKILQDMLLTLETKEGKKWEGDIAKAIHLLPIGDLETLMIRIRENTYGPKFFHDGKCSHCDKIVKNLRLDLDSLALDAMSIEDLKKSKVVKLPKSNLDAELKPLYLEDLYKAIKIAKEGTSTVVTSSIAVSLKKLGDNSHVTPEDIDNIPASDLVYLQEQLDEMKLEGSIDTNVEVLCPHCNQDFDMKLGVFDPLFFAPTKATKTTRT